VSVGFRLPTLSRVDCVDLGILSKKTEERLSHRIFKASLLGFIDGYTHIYAHPVGPATGTML